MMFEGITGTPSISESTYQFHGIERLLGLVPMLLGGGIFYLLFTNQTVYDEIEDDTASKK